MNVKKVVFIESVPLLEVDCCLWSVCKRGLALFVYVQYLRIP